MANISHLKHCEPEYVEMPGWRAQTRGCRRFDELPRECRDYVGRLEELCGAAIDVVSVGPDRDDTIVRRQLV
jgi:adenylosuccinate synthase